MPIPIEILTRIQENDPTLVHLDLTFPHKMYFNDHMEIWLASNAEQEQGRLNDDDILVLGKALSHNTYLKSINLNKNKVGALGLRVLATKQLETLCLSQNGLNNDSIDALLLHTELTSLDVSENMFADESLAKLGQLECLSLLDVSGNEIGPLAMAAYAEKAALKILYAKDSKLLLHEESRAPLPLDKFALNETLECLDISKNIINITSLKVISKHPALQKFNIQRCILLEDGYYFYKPANVNPVKTVNTVTEFLSQIPKLTWLNMRAVCLEPAQDMDVLAIFLAHIPLTYLDVSDIQMSAMGAIALAGSTTLRTLIANRNHIGPSGLLALANNTYITHLELSYNNLKVYPDSRPEIRKRNYGQDGALLRSGLMVEVMCMFEQNETLRTLKLSHQRIPGENYILDEYFARLIQNNTTLKSLDISHSAYNVNIKIIQALSLNTTLQAITFSTCFNDDEAKNKLAKNYSLMTIRCVTAYPQKLDPYTEKIQERNRNLAFAMIMFMLSSMKPTLHRAVNTNCKKVLKNLYLLFYMAEFLMPVDRPSKLYFQAKSIFKERSKYIDQTECPKKRKITL